MCIVKAAKANVCRAGVSVWHVCECVCAGLGVCVYMCVCVHLLAGAPGSSSVEPGVSQRPWQRSLREEPPPCAPLLPPGVGEGVFSRQPRPWGLSWRRMRLLLASLGPGSHQPHHPDVRGLCLRPAHGCRAQRDCSGAGALQQVPLGSTGCPAGHRGSGLDPEVL